jgi:cytochrome c biogenesis protein CcmG/thiol:disulfide interchange protein DsbE
MSSLENSSINTEPAAVPARVSARRPLLIALLIGLLVVVIGVISLLIRHQPSSQNASPLATTTAQVGKPVPTFRLPNLTGVGTVGVAENGGGMGKAAVLVFFASWCGPCQQEMPALAAAVSNGAAGTAAVIGIDGADGQAAAQAFVKKDNVTFPVGVDSVYAVTSGEFGFAGLPETVFVNGKGIITEIHFGATTPALLRQGVRAMGAQ